MVTHFCCCCNLRSGSIVFTWLQLMCLVITIASLASPLDMINYRFLNEQYSFLIPVYGLLITTQVIKFATCLSLIWGLIKNNHMFYQPWLFIQGTENVLVSISIISVIVIGCIQPPVLILLIPLGVNNGLFWYFWACIYATYKNDTKISPSRTNEDYEVLTVTSSVC
ncbi:hypothetical protein CBL_01168 [Carabus blaptoides fortunei]